MRITVANDQEGQLDNNHRICKTNLVDPYYAAHKKPTRSMRFVVGSIGGLLCALFSLNAAAYTGVCARDQVHTVVIPMPSIITPGQTIVARVPISFRCMNQPIILMTVTNPNLYAGANWVGKDFFPSPYINMGNPGDQNVSIWYRLGFENTKVSCVNGSASANASFPSTQALYPQASSAGTGYIAAPLTYNPMNVLAGSPCAGTEDLSTDAVFTFTVGDRVPSGPLTGIVATIDNRLALLPGIPAGRMTVNLVFGGGMVLSKLCQMSTSGDVQMGKVPAKDIEAGTTSNVQTTISITNCPANVGIALTASDVATPGNTSNILTLKDASDPSVVKGVGISFSYGDDNTPITLGQAKRVIANTVEGTQPAIALKARYVKNGPGTVTAGRANAQATLTLSYQ